MTRISQMNGIGAFQPGDTNYVPYTKLTQGEMSLWLLRQRTDLLAATTGDPVYKKASTMLSNALNGGVSRGVQFIGAVDTELEGVARAILAASRQTAPASRIGLIRSNIYAGVNADTPIVPTSIPDCVQYATKKANTYYGKDYDWDTWEKMPAILNTKAKKRRYLGYKAECQVQQEIEKILNERMTNASMHVVYNTMQRDFQPIIGSAVITKSLLHVGGVQALGNAASVDSGLMRQWTEIGIERTQVQNGIGVVGSIWSSLALAPDPQAYMDQYKKKYLDLKKNKTAGAGLAGAPHVGEPVIATVIAIGKTVAAITAAIKAAQALYNSIAPKKQGVFSVAQGYGTTSFQAEKTDYITPGSKPPAGTPGSNNDLLLYGGLAAGAYFLFAK